VRAAPQSAKVTWDCADVRAIEETWKATGVALEKLPPPRRVSKGGAYRLLEILLWEIMKEHFSASELRELAVSCATMPADSSSFHESLIRTMLCIFVGSHDREGIVTLLSVHCPWRVGFSNLEDYLAYSKDLIKDPILVLGEAFAKAKDEWTRARLAAAVRRAFIGSGIRGKDDPEFVNNAMRWYERNKEKLTINHQYNHNYGTLDVRERYSTNPLFIFKDAEKREREER
jgi:hypothetical protein